VFGGVGMGPQEHAFRSGVDVIVGRRAPARSLPQPYAKLAGSSTSSSTKPIACSTWAFCPTSDAILRHIPSKRQTLFFSATMPPPIVKLSHEMLHDAVMINLERRPRRRPASRTPSTRFLHISRRRCCCSC
jgi:ATP-dependent RNA helicase RhlE